MAQNSETLIAILRTATANMNHSELTKFSKELQVRLPEVINQAAKVATDKQTR